MIVINDEQLKEVYTDHHNLFDKMMELQGECVYAKENENRYVQRVNIQGQQYFLKQHFGIGWKEFFKPLLVFKFPVFSAKREWQAIHRLNRLGVDVPQVAAYGFNYTLNLANMKSFIMTKSLVSTISLEDYCKDWKCSPPPVATKKAIIRKVAQITQNIHKNNINHRDLYMCHLLLELTDGKNFSLENPKIYLIDLHRAQKRLFPRNRWFIKDLAGIYFSSKDFGLTLRDLLLFIKIYRGLPLKTIWRQECDFWKKVLKQGEALYHKINQKKQNVLWSPALVN